MTWLIKAHFIYFTSLIPHTCTLDHRNHIVYLLKWVYWRGVHLSCRGSPAPPMWSSRCTHTGGYFTGFGAEGNTTGSCDQCFQVYGFIHKSYRMSMFTTDNRSFALNMESGLNLLKPFTRQLKWVKIMGG